VGQRGLAEAGQVLDQQMSTGQQRDEGEPHFRNLAQHQRVDLILGLPQGLAQLIG